MFLAGSFLKSVSILIPLGKVPCKDCYFLTLKCLNYFSLHLCTRGGGPLRPIHIWVLFRRNFGTKLAPLCAYTQNNHVAAKRMIKKCFFFSKWRPKNKFSFREKSRVTKIWKKKWNLAQSWRTWIQLHFWNKIWKKNLFQNGGHVKHAKGIVQVAAYLLYLHLKI